MLRHRTSMVSGLIFLCTTFLFYSHASNKSPSFDSVGNGSAATEKNKPADKCAHCSPPGDQIIYIPLMELPEARESELVFNSRSPEAVDVTPTFYKADGAVVTGETVRVDSTEIRYVKLRKLIPTNHRGERDWGGMTLSYYGDNREIWAQLRFLGVNGGNSVDEFFSVAAESHADLYEAVWWAPKDSTSIVALGNLTEVPTSAVVRFGNQGSQTINLAPHATEIVRCDAQKIDGSASITISVTGAAGSIVPTGLIAARNGAFNSVIRFYSPKLSKQPNLFANGFRVSNITPHMVLKNTTSDPIAAQAKFIALEGSEAVAPVILPEVILAAYETIEVNLSELSEAAKTRDDFDIVSVEVSSSGIPGSLIGSIYGINAKTGVDYDIPLRDSGPVRTMTGSYPWKITKDYTTVVYITNISDRDAGFITQINYDGGQRFVIDPRTLKPGETAVFDLAKIRDEQMPDNVGRHLPKESTIGQFKWAVHGLTGGKLLLIGRAEMVSRSERVSTSYSCNDPCPPTYGGSIDPFLPPIVVVGSATTGIWESAYYGNGYVSGPYTAGASWTIDNSSIATCDPADGHMISVCGSNAGSGNLTAFIRMEESYGWDGLNCYDNNNAYAVEGNEGVEVRPSLTSIAPNRGPVGGTVNVFIFGDGFTASSTVTISGSGVTHSTVNFDSSTQLSTIFQIATDAIEGNHAVSVTTNDVTSNSVNFFVQIPTKLRRDSISNLISQPNGCGVIRNLSYTLLDQSGQAIAVEDTITETFSNFSGPEGLRPPNETSAQMSGGVVNDTVGYLITDCPPSFTASFTQGFDAVIGTHTFHLTSSNAISMGRTSSGTKFVDISFSQ